MKIQYCPPGPSLASRGTTGHTFLLASQGPMDGTPWCTSKGREKSQELLPWGQLSDSCDPMGALPAGELQDMAWAGDPALLPLGL